MGTYLCTAVHATPCANCPAVREDCINSSRKSGSTAKTMFTGPSEGGVPPDYDRLLPETTQKRRKGERKECGNCGEEFAAGFHEYFPEQEMRHWPHAWCSAECYLSFARSNLVPRHYTALEAAVWTLEQRQVVPRPSRYHLERYGGTMDIEDYRADQPEQPGFEAGTKRIRVYSEAQSDCMEF